MLEDRIELRAERLRCLIAAIGEEPTMQLRDTFALGLIPGGWNEYLAPEACGSDDDDIEFDIDLAFQCADVAREIRAKQWRALEVADAVLAAGGDGPLPAAEQGRLARAILLLGWATMPDEEED
jgi:hypothetical protein